MAVLLFANTETTFLAVLITLHANDGRLQGLRLGVQACTANVFACA